MPFEILSQNANGIDLQIDCLDLDLSGYEYNCILCN